LTEGKNRIHPFFADSRIDVSPVLTPIIGELKITYSDGKKKASL